MPNRGLKNRTAISTSIEKERYAWLKEYSAKSHINLSVLFDLAIDELRKAVEKK